MTERNNDAPVVGLTGARFGGARRRRRRLGATPVPGGPETPTEPLAVPTGVGSDTHPEPPGGSLVGRTGARFGRVAVAADPEPPPPEPVPLPAPVEEPVDADDGAQEGDGIRVRPYVLTGGRTRASRDLPVEALVSTAVAAGPATTAEQRLVLALCAQPRSVAEIAALVGVPLGVARVLVGDLADAGAVSVNAGAVADLDLMRRVLDGLRRL